MVGLAGLTANTTTRSSIDLLKRTDVTLYIDTTVAEIWLPVEICEAFEDAFGLTYDNTTNLYLVDDLLHQTLLAQNPSITFILNQAFSTDQTVHITLPYAAFDLEAKPPYRTLNETTKYFPLRRGADKTQWVLGRTFFQEAYVSVDWERSRFSVYQCDWTYGKSSHIVPIVSPSYASASAASKDTTDLSTGAIVGIAVGGVLVLVFFAAAIAWWLWRRRHNTMEAEHAGDAAGNVSPTDSDVAHSSPASERGPNVFLKAELPGQSNVNQPELSSDAKEKGSLEVVEVENTERPIYEMPGDTPTTPEAGGRQLSEKETMMAREKIINGVDPNARIEPIPAATHVRPAPIASLNDIAMVGTRLPSSGVSLTSPRAPRDGGMLEASDIFQLQPYRNGWSVEDLLSPISPVEALTSTDSSRRRFSYES